METLAPERALVQAKAAFLPLMEVPSAPLMTKIISTIRRKRKMRKPIRTRMRLTVTPTKMRRTRKTQTSRMRTASISWAAVAAPLTSRGSRRLRCLAPMMRTTRKVAGSMSLPLSLGRVPPATALRSLRQPKSASKVSQSPKGARVKASRRQTSRRLSQRTTLAPRV